jgi:hypothetical protein
MTRTTITLLFTKNKSEEPPGILQCDTSGEYYHYYFYDWRHAVHYFQWSLNKRESETQLFREWSTTYGYDEYESFTGDLNEFRVSEDPWIIFTSIGTVKGDMDLNTISAWTFDIDYILYDGIGSCGKDNHTIDEFLDIMKKHSHEFMPPPKNSDIFTLMDWIDYSGAEIIYKSEDHE